MVSKTKQGKTVGTRKGRTPSGKSAGKRPSRSARTSTQAQGTGILSKIQKPRFLPFLTLWFVAVAVLAGLVYWGETSRPLTSKSHVKRSTAHTASPRHTDHRARTAVKESRTAPASRTQGERQHEAVVRAKAAEAVKPPRDSDAPHGKTPEKLALALAPSSSTPAPVPPVPSPPSPTVSPTVARVAIVIDDFGLDLHAAQRFLSLPFPITFSVLPYLRHSREIAELAHSQNHEVILHVPMEPQGFPKVNPGPGALLLSMSDGQIRKAVESALDSCPHLSGINNHMGSRFTEKAAPMHIVLEELNRRGLYFLDSRTSPKSVGESTAAELHVPSIRRDIFLDHTDSEAFVRSQLAQLIRKAKIQGSAVAIGHPHDATWKVLSHAADIFRAEGIAVVSASQLLTPTHGGVPGWTRIR